MPDLVLSPDLVPAHQLRSAFSSAMSQMYRKEVPAYGALIEIVQQVNDSHLALLEVSDDEDITRLSDERHGAIRVGTAAELAMLARIFGVMGMYPVSYYDLGSAGIPVHSTAFRPIDRDALAHNPFRVFTSLLRLELIEDAALRDKAAQILASRTIFTKDAITLTQRAEEQGGLHHNDAAAFIAAVLETFRWTGQARVDEATYHSLHSLHRLIADVVSFQGPHINHLTPRTLDIDACQEAMVTGGLPAKSVIEGPPARNCPILLRQTSFKALTEEVSFDGSETLSGHTARFGEIEQRGIALTTKGRALYDSLLAEVRARITPAADGSNGDEYRAILAQIFQKFPDEWRDIHDQKLGYFRYHRAIAGAPLVKEALSDALDAGVITLSPIIYEDFLPVSAAGIFQSNLGDEVSLASAKGASQHAFEEALGMVVYDEFEQYHAISEASLAVALTG